MKLSGQVTPHYAFRSFRLEPSLGSWAFDLEHGTTQIFRRARFYLAVVNYLLVFFRTFNEIKACRKVRATTGSIRPYLSGVFTLLELFNLTCNYIGLAFRIYEQFEPQRRYLEQ